MQKKQTNQIKTKQKTMKKFNIKQNFVTKFLVSENTKK